jgi:hypothetical protein
MTTSARGASHPDMWCWRLAIALVGLAGLVAVSVAYVYGNGLNGPPIRSDGFGYHAYLPALLIHHDVTFSAFVHSFPDGALPPGISWREDAGVFFNKYPIGVAVLEAPFFLVADAFVRLAGGERTGLSAPYQVANMVAGSTYFLLGTLLLWRLLIRFFQSTTVVWTLAIVIFGTNLFHYASYDASFSHVYSWFLVAAYLLALVRYRERPERGGTALLIGALLGLIVITRVPNGIVGVLAVAVWLDVWGRDCLGRRALRDLALFSLGLVVALLPLVLYWYGAIGRLVVYSYGEKASFGRTRRSAHSSSASRRGSCSGRRSWSWPCLVSSWFRRDCAPGSASPPRSRSPSKCISARAGGRGTSAAASAVVPSSSFCRSSPFPSRRASRGFGTAASGCRRGW